VVQVSPQISSSESAGKTQSPEQGSLKKDKLGVFAKLLEGLIGKRKTPSSQAAAEKPGGEELSLEAGESAGKTASRNRKKLSAARGDALGDAPEGGEEGRGAEAALLAPVPPPELPGLKAGAGEGEGEAEGGLRGAGPGRAGPEPALSAGAERARRGEGPETPAPGGFPAFEGEAPAEFAGTELAAGEELLREELREQIPETRDRNAGEQDRPFRGLVDIFPHAGRGAEEESLRLAGTKRAGLSGTDKEGREGNRLAEARSGKRKGERLAVQVQDQRAGESAAPGILPEHAGAKRPVSGSGGPELELAVNLHPGEREPEARTNAGIISAPGRAFEDLLTRELHQNLNGDIVRHASIILRDHGEGTIRLSLRPESLGNVKIRLEMAENKITGHIVVESGEALRAFEREIRSLEQAFRESGFESASLDMSLASGNGQEGQGGQWEDRRADNPYTERLAASRYDTATETAGLSEGGSLSAALSAASPGREAVNMLV
jgi:hypothetical protein